MSTFVDRIDKAISVKFIQEKLFLKSSVRKIQIALIFSDKENLSNVFISIESETFYIFRAPLGGQYNHVLQHQIRQPTKYDRRDSKRNKRGERLIGKKELQS